MVRGRPPGTCPRGLAREGVARAVGRGGGLRRSFVACWVMLCVDHDALGDDAADHAAVIGGHPVEERGEHGGYHRDDLDAGEALGGEVVGDDARDGGDAIWVEDHSLPPDCDPGGASRVWSCGGTGRGGSTRAVVVMCRSLPGDAWLPVL